MRYALVLCVMVAAVMLSSAPAQTPDGISVGEAGTARDADGISVGEPGADVATTEPDASSDAAAPQPEGIADRGAGSTALLRHRPVTTARPFVFIPADGSCCTR